MRSIHVLLVEDVDTLRGMLRDYLSEEGFSVDIARDCAAARKMAQSTAADVIVSDIRLPDGCGMSMCREIQQQRPGIGVVLMTGFVNQPIPAWIHDEKIPLLDKPLDLISLANTIRTVAPWNPEPAKRAAG